MINFLSHDLIVLSVTASQAIHQITLAYLGPGAAISTIGTFLALLAAILVAFVGFFWYPIKRMLGKKKPQEPDAVHSPEAAGSAVGMGNLSWYRQKLPILLIIGAFCSLSFGFGAVVVGLKVFPYSVLDRGYVEFKQLTADLSSSFFYPRRYDESGTIIHDREQIMPGSTLLATHWPETDWTPGIRLIDVDGNILNHWETRPQEIWPESPFEDYAKDRYGLISDNNSVHGTYLYPNGDIIFNIDYAGLIRMDSCGRILWKLPYRTHHSVDRDSEGNFWVPGLQWVEAGDERASLFPGLETPFTDSTIIKVSPEGEILREISLLESLYYSDYRHLLWNNGPLTNDILHINDVELLTVELAEKFPLFEAGDLMVSSNHLSFIAVLSQTGEIKWISSGDFTNQHDPDFEENGLIVVFDNRKDIPTSGSDIGASKIRAIDPGSGEVRDIYPIDGEGQFYTPTAGKHQKLKNGNRLIVEATAGRVFEVSPAGETVWEWISETRDGELVPEVFEGVRYDIDAGQVASWECSGPP